MTEPRKTLAQKDMDANDELDMDQIVHNAVASVSAEHTSELTWRMRFGLILAGIIVIFNSVVGIYNSLALRDEVSCNHQLQIALGVVGDQNRINTKQIIDTVLSGKPLTAKQLVDARKAFDKAYAKNTAQRAQLLKTTCTNGDNPSSSLTPSSSPSS